MLWSFCRLRVLGTASQPLRTHSRLERPSFASHAKGHFGFAQVSEAWHSGVRQVISLSPPGPGSSQFATQEERVFWGHNGCLRISCRNSVSES